MAIQRFDELNNIVYGKYFDVMDISDEEKKRRIKLSEDFEDIVLFFFAYFDIDYEVNQLYAIVEERIKIIAERYLNTENLVYINEWAKRFAKQVVDETVEKINSPVPDDEVFNFDEEEIEISKNEYWTSDIRAKFISRGIANQIGNFKEMLDAVNKGYTFKVWNTEKDNRVRQSHRDVDGQTVRIYEAFDVGGYDMLFPTDDSMGAQLTETSNCRCHVTYK